MLLLFCCCYLHIKEGHCFLHPRKDKQKPLYLWIEWGVIFMPENNRLWHPKLINDLKVVVMCHHSLWLSSAHVRPSLCSVTRLRCQTEMKGKRWTWEMCRGKEGKREEVRHGKGWREQRESPAAKASAGSVVELFIILSLMTMTCGPLCGRREERQKKTEWELKRQK